MKRPTVYYYLSYTEYLRDWLSFKKESQSNFSLRNWARELKLTPAYISMILSRKRPLNPKLYRKFIGNLELNKKESEYFMALVDYQNETSPEKKEEQFKALSQYRLFQESHPRDLVLNKYLSHPLHVLVRELTEHSRFQPDPDWMANELWIAPKKSEISKALKFLKEHGFLNTDEHGDIRPTDFQLDCSGEALRASMGSFHRVMYKIAADSVEKIDRQERNLLGHVACLSEQQFKEVRETLDEAISKIQKITSRNEPKEHLYYVGMQVFPLTKKGIRK